MVQALAIVWLMAAAERAYTNADSLVPARQEHCKSAVNANVPHYPALAPAPFPAPAPALESGPLSQTKWRSKTGLFSPL